MKNKKIIYYNDELKDDFAGNDIKTEPIEQNFNFLRKSFCWKLAVLFLYRLLMC